MMYVLTSETCWGLNNEIIKQVTSSWFLFIQSVYLFVFASWMVRSRLGQTIFFVSLSLFVEVTDIPLTRPRALSFLSFPVHHSAFRRYIFWDTASIVKHYLLKVFRLLPRSKSNDLRLQCLGDSLGRCPPPGQTGAEVQYFGDRNRLVR